MQTLHKLRAQPAFTITTTAVGVAGLCLAVKGVALTLAAASTVPVVMAVAGTCIALSAAWTLKVRIFDKSIMQLRGGQPALGAPNQDLYPSALRQIGDALCRMATLQMVSLWNSSVVIPVPPAQ